MVSLRWRPATDSDVLVAVRHYLSECFARQTAPRVSELSLLLGISRTRVTRAVQRQTGLTCGPYIRNQQAAFAKKLIDAGTPLTEVAYRSGFGTRRTFFRVFKQVTGITPNCYRRTK